MKTPSQISSADLDSVTGGARGAGQVITNPWNPGFWTQGLRGVGAGIRAPLSGNVKVKTGDQIYCMPGATCNFIMSPLKPLKK